MDSLSFNHPKPRLLCRLTLPSGQRLSPLLLLGLAALLFAPNSGRAAGGGLPGYVILPLSYMGRANQACISVTINDRPTRLILDTGAYATLLDSRFYQGMRAQAGSVSDEQLPPELRQKKVNANGEKAEIGYINSMRSGAMDFGKGPVVVTDLDHLLRRYNSFHPGATVAGLLGQDVLRRYSALIDWHRRGVYFNTDPSKRIRPDHAFTSNGWTAVPMAPTNGRHFTVACTVEGKPVRLMVDTGAQFTSFNDGIMPLPVIHNRDTGSSMVRLASTASTLSMIGLDSNAYPARIEHWKIGNYEIALSYVAVSKFPPKFGTEQSAGDGPILGLLGAEILSANNAIIDVAGSTLYLKPNSR